MSIDHSLVVYEKNIPVYPIYYTTSFLEITEIITKEHYGTRKLCIVSDTNVSAVYCKELETALSNQVKKIVTFVFLAGEQYKNLHTVEKLYDMLIHMEFDRNDVLLALGGGVVGDLAGFAAATYLRGIRYFQYPTSLLAMVDSSIGGKTGIDFCGYKNIVGSFYTPAHVYMNIQTLDSLPDQEFYSGMGEIIKHGLILDKEYYHWIKLKRRFIEQKDAFVLRELIMKSCKIKLSIVEEDPAETGNRVILNFGHTIGHAIESQTEFALLHGECIGLGMVAASFLSMQRGYLTLTELQEIENTIKEFHLPIRCRELSEKAIIDVIRKDKKMDAGHIHFVLLKQIGQACIDKTISSDELSLAIQYIKTG